MFLSLPEYTQDLRINLRKQRVYNEQLKRIHLDQKEKIERLEEEKRQLKKELDKFKKENEKLKQEIEKITKTNNRYQVGLFDHGNFKSPTEKERKTNGGQRGHADTNQDKKRDYKSFKKQRIFAKRCGKCGHSLSRVNATTEKLLIDIQINTQLTQMILSSERQWCSHCKKEVTAKSAESLPFSEYGINTFMMILLMRFKSNQSLGNISSSLYFGFGLRLSPSAILSLLRQAKEYLSDKYEKLKQEIRRGQVMYNDETGWLVHGQKAWMWIMTNEKMTVYVAAESRGKGIFEQMYGDSKATSMHDGYSSYASVTGMAKAAYCWSHILRFSFEETVLEKKPTDIACQIRDRLVDLYQTVVQHKEWSREQKEKTLRSELDALLALSPTDESSKNILYRVKTQKEGLILALLLTPDGTNNLAERELRSMAIKRGISYGSATFKGMETTAVLGSIVQTISRDKEKQFIPSLKEYLLTGIAEKYPQYKHPASFAP